MVRVQSPAANGYLNLLFPSQWILTGVQSSDISIPTPSVVATVTVNTTDNMITLKLASQINASTAIRIQVGNTNDPRNPANSGEYYIGIHEDGNLSMLPEDLGYLL